MYPVDCDSCDWKNYYLDCLIHGKTQPCETAAHAGLFPNGCNGSCDYVYQEAACLDLLGPACESGLYGMCFDYKCGVRDFCDYNNPTCT